MKRRSITRIAAPVLVALAAAFAPEPARAQGTGFVPGTQPLFVDDFSGDNIGDFPRRLEYVAGNMAVTDWHGRLYLRASAWPSRFAIVLPAALPERFTVEFLATPALNYNDIIVRFAQDAVHDVRFRHHLGKQQAAVFGGEQQTFTPMTEDMPLDQVFRARIMVDGGYVKVFVNDAQLANVPNAQIGRSNRITFEIPAKVDHLVHIGDIRVMATVADANPAGQTAACPAYRTGPVLEGRPATFGMCPGEGSAGTAVSLVGQNFDRAMELQFGKQRNVPFVRNGDGSISFRVPEVPQQDSTNAPVMLRTADGIAGSNFVPPFRRQPRVDSIRPLRAARGDTLTLYGADLHLIGVLSFQPRPNVREATTTPAGGNSQARRVVVVGNADSGALRWEAADGMNAGALPFSIEVVARTTPPTATPPRTTPGATPPRERPTERECPRTGGRPNRRCQRN